MLNYNRVVMLNDHHLPDRAEATKSRLVQARGGHQQRSVTVVYFLTWHYDFDMPEFPFMGRWWVEGGENLNFSNFKNSNPINLNSRHPRHQPLQLRARLRAAH